MSYLTSGSTSISNLSFCLTEAHKFGLPLLRTQRTGICAPELTRESAHSSPSGIPKDFLNILLGNTSGVTHFKSNLFYFKTVPNTVFHYTSIKSFINHLPMCMATNIQKLPIAMQGFIIGFCTSGIGNGKKESLIFYQ